MVRELRIGNLILMNGEQSQVYQIEHRFKQTYRINDIIIDERIIKDRFEGIELTPEWLERFSFEKKRKQFSLSVGGELINYWTGAILIWEVKKGVYTLDSVFRNPIHGHPNPSTVYTTVHSLQNLTFALTSRELELKK